MVKRRSDGRGFALLLVLWSVTLLSLLCTQLVANADIETQLAANARTSAELEAAADAGLHEATFRMPDSSAQHWRADGNRRALRLEHTKMDVLLESLDGK